MRHSQSRNWHFRSEPERTGERVFCTRCNFERFIFINSTNCRQLRFIRQPETSFEWAERTFCSLSKPLENCRLPPHPSPDLIISHCPRVDKLLTGKLYCAFPLKRSPRVEDVAINGVIMVFFLFQYSRRGYLSGRGISQRQTNDLMEFSEIFLDHLHLSSLKIDSPWKYSKSKSNFYCALRIQ